MFIVTPCILSKEEYQGVYCDTMYIIQGRISRCLLWHPVYYPLKNIKVCIGKPCILSKAVYIWKPCILSKEVYIWKPCILSKAVYIWKPCILSKEVYIWKPCILSKEEYQGVYCDTLYIIHFPLKFF